MLNSILGDKPWFKSMTAWGVLILTAAWTVVPLMGEMGLVTIEVSASMTKWLTVISTPLNLIGIRRAATAKNVA